MKKNKIRLGVNIDHIATLRQARGTPYPDVVAMAVSAQNAGAEQITLHLREDRRHIQPDDLPPIRQKIKNMNLEMALTDEMITLAVKIKPTWVCLVPEKRRELTTEGGLAVDKNLKKIAQAMQKFHQHKIKVSLFINAEPTQVAAAVALGADAVEFHTGRYADLFIQKDTKKSKIEFLQEINNLSTCAKLACEHGLSVHAGHGLTLENVVEIIKIPEISELNIGHAIVCDALIYGWERAVKMMISAININV